jgi:hypothetical protein
MVRAGPKSHPRAEHYVHGSGQFGCVQLHGHRAAWPGGAARSPRRSRPPCRRLFLNIRSICINRHQWLHRYDTVPVVELLLPHHGSDIQPRLLLRNPAVDLVDRKTGGPLRHTSPEHIPGRCPRPPPRSACLRQRSCGSFGPICGIWRRPAYREDALNRGEHRRRAISQDERFLGDKTEGINKFFPH